MARAVLSLPKQCYDAGLPEPETEVQFHPVRKWRADFLWRSPLVILEVDGGGFINGRHSRGTGIEKDCEKVNAAAALGYRVLRATPAMVNDGRALDAIRAVLFP